MLASVIARLGTAKSVVILLLAAVVGAALSLVIFHSLGPSYSSDDLRENLRNKSPLAIHQRPNPSLLPVTWASTQSVIEVPEEGKLNPSLCLHLLKLYGRNAEIKLPNQRYSGTILSILTDSDLGKRIFGDVQLVKTPFGVRFPTVVPRRRSIADEAHRDQCLATFAEIGVPLSETLTISGERFSVLDALIDSTLNFSLDQDELEWSSVAYVLYLPPRSEWHNRFGAKYSFDELADELMRRDLKKSSCAGMHVLISLAVFLEVDRQSPILTGSTRSSIVRYLNRNLTSISHKQNVEGFWSLNWMDSEDADTNRISRLDTLESRILVTGHILEFLSYLPHHLSYEPKLKDAATDWLRNRLTGSSPAEFWSNICPYTHGAFALATPSNDVR
jgi:hypothetical protein